MSDLFIEGGHVITPHEERFTNILVENGRIKAVADNHPDTNNPSRYEHIDARGCYVTPGLIDLQVNGDPSCNLWGDPTRDEFEEMRVSLARAGVTSFLPTLITDAVEHLKKNIDLLSDWMQQIRSEAQEEPVSKRSSKRKRAAVVSRPLGIHLEGPCLSPEKPGVHPPQWIAPPNIDLFEKIINDDVRLMTMACEQDKNGACIEWLQKRGVVVSLGHSNANFEEAECAFNRGVNLMTHTFNALPPLHHRNPGAVGAALLDKRVSCCLIADGLHLSRQAVELIIKLKGCNSSVLVTDIAHIGTSGGELVGSSITLDMAVRNVVNWEVVSFAEAIRMSTFNPARAVGLNEHIGSIHEGAAADLLLWDINTLALKQVIIGGQTANHHLLFSP